MGKRYFGNPARKTILCRSGVVTKYLFFMFTNN